LVNPHVKQNSFIVGSHFYPEGIEVHHAIFFLVPPDLAKLAVADDKNGKAGPVSVSHRSRFVVRPGLEHTVADGVGPDMARMWSRRDGCGVPQRQPRDRADPLQPPPGDAPVRAKLTLVTVPASTPLKPLHLNLLRLPRTSRVRPE